MASSTVLNRSINQTFRKRGLTLRAGAAEIIRGFLASLQDNQPAMQVTLDKLVECAKQKAQDSTIVEEKMIEDVLSGLQGEENKVIKENIFVIDAFQTPQFKFNTVRKSFERVELAKSLHGSAEAKADMFRERYRLLHQRVVRCFAKSLSSEQKDRNFEITMISSLLGQPGHKCIFGMLTQLKEGEYSIEDLNGSVKIDIGKAKIMSGLFTENCMVLADGESKDDMFTVRELGFPPAESRMETLTTFPILDMQSNGDRKFTDRQMLHDMEKGHEDDMVIILSDVWLDRPQVMEKIRTLLEGFSEIVPPVFVFMGNFTSRPLGFGDDINKLKRYFDELAGIISEFPTLVEGSQFIFIPGPQDPGVGNVFPRPGLAAIFTEKLRAKISHATFASNPCRISFYSKEIVLFREDLLHKMRRNCILPPNTEESNEISEHLVKTVLEQAHLCPLPPLTRPVYWNYDHALRLYPVPDFLVLADCVDQYQWKHDRCQSLNPGSFVTDYSFVVLRPLHKESTETNSTEDQEITRAVEFSQVVEQPQPQQQSQSQQSTLQLEKQQSELQTKAYEQSEQTKEPEQPEQLEQLEQKSDS